MRVDTANVDMDRFSAKVEVEVEVTSKDPRRLTSSNSKSM